MYEVELKALITSTQAAVATALSQMALTPPLEQVYEDVYFDDYNAALAASRRELRIRTIITAETNSQKVVFTYKEPPFDSSTDSKPEFEVVVTEGSTLAHILRSLGYDVTISFAKRCNTFHLAYLGFDVVATICTISDVADTFLEIEALVSSLDKTNDATRTLFSLLEELHVPMASLVTDAYTDMVRRARRDI